MEKLLHKYNKSKYLLRVFLVEIPLSRACDKDLDQAVSGRGHQEAAARGCRWRKDRGQKSVRGAFGECHEQLRLNPSVCPLGP